MKKAIVLGAIFLFLMSNLQAWVSDSSDFDLISFQELAKEIKNPNIFNSERVRAAFMYTNQIKILGNELMGTIHSLGPILRADESTDLKVKNFILEHKINKLEQHPETAWIYYSITEPLLIDFKKMEDFIVSRSFNLIRFQQGVEAMKISVIDFASFIENVVNSTEARSVTPYSGYKEEVLEYLSNLMDQIADINPDLLVQGEDIYSLETLPEEVRDIARTKFRVMGIDILLGLRKPSYGKWYDSWEKIRVASEALYHELNLDIREEDPERFKRIVSRLMKEIENGINELSQDIANL